MKSKSFVRESELIKQVVLKFSGVGKDLIRLREKRRGEQKKKRGLKSHSLALIRCFSKRSLFLSKSLFVSHHTHTHNSYMYVKKKDYLSLSASLFALAHTHTQHKYIYIHLSEVN